MGGFLGIGNSSAKTDRGNQLAGINAAWNVYNRGLPLSDKMVGMGETTTAEGKDTISRGLTTLDDAKRYWQAIMSGDKVATMGAAAPAINARNEMDAAARSQQAQMGTSRGGGTAAANVAAESERIGDITDIIGAQQPTAAQAVQRIGTEEAAIGAQQAQIGRDQLSQALQALGLSKQVSDQIIDSSMQSRQISHGLSPARGFEYVIGKAVAAALADATSALGF